MTSHAPIAVTGVGQCGPAAQDPRSVVEMVLDAVEAALADAQIGMNEIDAVVTASVDLLDGLTASSACLVEVVGSVMKPETRISGDGLAAAAQAACQIWAGAYQTVLVVGHAKPSMTDFADVSEWAMDAITLQPLGANFLVCAGLQAAALAEGDDDAIERWANIASLRRTAVGEKGIHPKLSPNDVLVSPMLASPLRVEMAAPLADAAWALVLRGTAPPSPHALIKGLGHDLACHAPGDRHLTRWDGLERACTRAYAMADITDPKRDFCLLEPSCFYAHEEELFLAASGTGGTNGSALLSPTGGLFAGATPIAAGLSRMAEATRFLRSAKAGSQALVHGSWGPAGQGQVVAILESAS